MKRSKQAICLITALMLVFGIIKAYAVFPEDFEKYEIISTAERRVVGVDAGTGIVYCENGEMLLAFDMKNDKKLFEIEMPEKITPFIKGTALVMGKNRNPGAIINKKGEKVKEVPAEYKYCNKFSCGFMCIVNQNITENIYTIIDNQGNVIAENFFALECELENGNIIIANSGGGFSVVKVDGAVEPLKLKKNVRIEDCVSVADGTYIESSGDVYSDLGELLYKNEDNIKISPVDKNFILAIRNNGTESNKYIIDIKNKKETIINDNGYLGDYIYTKGYVFDGKVIIGDDKKNVLLDVKTGEITVENILDYTKPVDGVCTVVINEVQPVYKFLKSDGTFIEGDWLFASSFENGIAVAVENKTGNIFAVDTKGKKTKIGILNGLEDAGTLHINNEKFNCFSHEGKIVEITSDGSIYVNNGEGTITVYMMKSEENLAKSAFVGMVTLISLGFVALIFGYIHKRKR